MSGYRGRLAPSPTGYLHLGHARTFLTAAERAEAAGGTLIFRMDDLDAQRSRPEFARAAVDDLTWLGIRWQEGPQPDGTEAGPRGSYHQSHRLPQYRTAFEVLRERGYAYPCRCSRRDLQRSVSAPHAEEEDEPVYPGTCRPADSGSVPWRSPSPSRSVSAISQNGGCDIARWEAAATPCSIPTNPAAQQQTAWRFRVPDGEVVEFEDQNLGWQRFTAGVHFGDFVLMRRDGVPSYQLASVVDDAAMQITEVVRGRDLLKSTARQILLQRALGYPEPAWFHCDLLLDEHGTRLAKRHDALSLRALREGGITPAGVRVMADGASSL